MTSQDIKKTIIEKWMPIFFRKRKNQYEPPCWLCELSRNLCSGKVECTHCVVCLFTKHWGCDDTPYWDWRKSQDRQTAREELLFLLRLYRKVRKGEIK